MTNQPPSSETLTEEQQNFLTSIRDHAIVGQDTLGKCIAIIDTLQAEVAALRAALRLMLDGTGWHTVDKICSICEEARRALDDAPP